MSDRATPTKKQRTMQTTATSADAIMTASPPPLHRSRPNYNTLVLHNKGFTTEDFVIHQDDYKALLRVLEGIRKQPAMDNRGFFPTEKQCKQLRRWLCNYPNDIDSIREFVKRLVPTSPNPALGTNIPNSDRPRSSNNSKGDDFDEPKVRVVSLLPCPLKLPSLVANNTLDHIEVLHLESVSTIKNFHDWIGKLPNLKSLEIACCNLHSVPQEVGDLLHLERLFVRADVYTGDDSSLPPCLWKLTNLRVLKLFVQGKGVHIPEEIEKLTELQELDLEDSSILSLPNSIGKLKNLKKLNLRRVLNLHQLPEEVGDLVHLEELNPQYSSICSLPLSTKKLENLKSLYLSNENLQNFLAENMGSLVSLEELTMGWEIGNLTSVQVLTMGYARVQKLPPWIGNFKHIQKLSLLHLDLNCLPDEIGNLVGLETLIVAGTGIVELPKSISRLQNLKELSLIGNQQLESLSSGIYDLRQLEKFRLVDSERITNLASIISHFFEHCPYLVTMNLPGCGISDLDPNIAIPPRLETLNLSWNPILGSTDDLSRPSPNPNLERLVECSRVLGSLGVDDWRLGEPGYQDIRYKLSRNRARSRILSCFDNVGNNTASSSSSTPVALWSTVLANARVAFAIPRSSTRDFKSMMRLHCPPREEDAIFSLLNGASWGVGVHWHQQQQTKQ